MGKRSSWLVAGLIAACTNAPDVPPPAEEPQIPAALEAAPPAPMVEPAPEPDFCAALAQAIARERDGYRGLRGALLARERWHASAVLPGTESCTIEGETWPRARLLCSGRPIAGDNRAGVDQEFEALAAEIDRCLARASWFPRNWQKGEPFRFAMGERQQTWTDKSTLPPSAIVLKAQQDLTSRDYRLHVNLETLR